MQVRFIEGLSLENLEQEINKFLAGIPDEPKSVRYDFDNLLAIIEYSNVRGGAICCECRYWDDSGSHDALIGLCQRCGGRKRFSDKSCNYFEDVRG